MLQTIWHRFSGQFFMLFNNAALRFAHYTVLHLKTLLLTANQNSTNNVELCQHREQNGAHHLKEH